MRLARNSASQAAGQSGEAHVFLTQDNNLTAKVPLRRSILQCNLQQKYRSTGKHNPQRDDGPEKGLYRLRPIALPDGFPADWRATARNASNRVSRSLEARASPRSSCPQANAQS